MLTAGGSVALPTHRCAIIAAMQRRTKIVATLGPATDHARTLVKMIEAGLDVARINFSHGEASEHRRRAAELRRIQHVEVPVDAEGADMGIGEVPADGDIAKSLRP